MKFVGSSLRDLRALPKPARQDMGRQLDRVQRGLDPNDWKPVSGVGPGVREIRVRDDTNTYRSIYLTSLDDAVYVLHVFTKKSWKTPTRDIRLARSRLQALQPRSRRET